MHIEVHRKTPTLFIKLRIRLVMLKEPRSSAPTVVPEIPQWERMMRMEPRLLLLPAVYNAGLSCDKAVMFFELYYKNHSRYFVLFVCRNFFRRSG